MKSEEHGKLSCNNMNHDTELLKINHALILTF